MSTIKFIYDTRERAIKDNIIAEFSKPHTFAVTKGTITIEEKTLPVADYVIVLDDKIAAVIERKTLKDYAASFKDGRNANNGKLLNARTNSGCQIYYIVEGASNPDYTTEYAGIKYQNILISTYGLMTRDNIHVIRTVDPTHTCKSLKMLCESYLRNADEARKEERSAAFSADSAKEIEPTDPEVAIPARSEISFEETLSAANFTPEEKLKICRVKSWATINKVGQPTAAIVATQFKLSDWILGNLDEEKVNNFTFNGRRNNNLITALSKRPNLEMQIKILSEMMGFSSASAADLLNQYSLEDLLLDRDYSHVRYGKRGTRLTADKINKIKNYLSNLNS